MQFLASLVSAVFCLSYYFDLFKPESEIMPTSPSSRFTFTRRQSASNKTPRQINRNLVFNLVRTRQPLSRADLARVSGLQPSTVSLIVEDLLTKRRILQAPTARP